jgi:hypothetical protein
MKVANYGAIFHAAGAFRRVNFNSCFFFWRCKFCLSFLYIDGNKKHSMMEST